MRTFLSFINWIFAKMGEGLAGQHRKFKRDLVNETGIALFLWFITSVVSSIVAMLVLLGVQTATGVSIPGSEIWIAYLAGCAFYLLYTAVGVMYNAFKAERAELFETIKNGR